MRIVDIFDKGPIPVSLEIFPGKGDLKEDDITNMLDEISTVSPAFISVTHSAGGSGVGNERTATLAAKIQDEYGITAAAHLTCINSTKAEIDHAIANLKSKGIQNVLALRGDRVPGCVPTDFHYACELISYLKENTDLCLGAGCYPEGHVECNNPDFDLDTLKVKQNAGADYLLSQLFFDNGSFYRFVDGARARGVMLPIEAGIMPIMSKNQLTRMVFLCGASLPAEVVRILYRYENNPESLMKAGLDYAAKQIEDLVMSGASNGIHLYCMSKPEVATVLTAAARSVVR